MLTIRKSTRSQRFSIHQALGGLFLLLVFSAFCTFSQNTTSVVSDPKQETEIRESVIRYEMDEWASEGDKHVREATNQNDQKIAQMLNFKIYFISINGTDPSDDFIKRFEDIPRSVKKVSESKQEKHFPSFVRDKKSHQQGIIFSADSIHWMKPGSVEVTGGYHCGGLCGAGVVYTVHLENGKWVVQHSRTTFIS